MINSVNSSGTEKSMNLNVKKSPQQGIKSETITDSEAYIVDIGNNQESKATYSNPGTIKPDIKRIEQLKKEADDALKPLRQMVEELLRKQGKSFNNAVLKANEGDMIEIDEQTRAEAQKLISDNGEYGIENTADRLFEFAKALSGGDKSKVDELKASIEQGYKEAEKAFGGELPDICKETLESAMNKLEEWASSQE